MCMHTSVYTIYDCICMHAGICNVCLCVYACMGACVYLYLYNIRLRYVKLRAVFLKYNLQDNLQDLLLIASLHGQYDQNCLASIVVVLLPV